MDRTPLSKGLISYEQISLFVYVTVISVSDAYVFIDGGSKVFSSDSAPHNAGGMEGYNRENVALRVIVMVKRLP
jgi:D-serine deaminase-like pyridoxal phosphate-dependent protein